jgi:hypothetical protein
MNAVILTALVLGLFGVVAAQAVIQTFYSDSNCATQAGPDVLGQNLSNPLVMPLDQCVKYYFGYMKSTSCGDTLARGTMYLDQNCTQTAGAYSYPIGRCAQTTGVPGTQSSKITSANCQPQPKTSAAATPDSVTLAFISVVFSVIALLL